MVSYKRCKSSCALDPISAQDIQVDLVQEKYVQENHVVEQSNVLSKSVHGPEVFTRSEDEQVSATEEALAPEIVHEAPIDVQKVGESDSRTGDIPKRSYASIVSKIHLGCAMCNVQCAMAPFGFYAFMI